MSKSSRTNEVIGVKVEVELKAILDFVTRLKSKSCDSIVHICEYVTSHKLSQANPKSSPKSYTFVFKSQEIQIRQVLET